MSGNETHLVCTKVDAGIATFYDRRTFETFRLNVKSLRDRITNLEKLDLDVSVERAALARVQEISSYWVTIPAGDFLMGAQKEDPSGRNYDPDAWSGELPVHVVHLSTYRIGRYPVTVAEYKRFVDEGGYANEGHWETGGFGRWDAPADWDEQLGHPKRPVVYVSWYEAAAYAAWAGFRLPTEAEWERAARGTEPDGILDMVGNGWDWCWDWFDDYSSNAQVDPRGPSKGDSRVLRGGSWYKNETCLRSTYRSWQRPDYRDNHIRFRVASTV